MTSPNTSIYGAPETVETPMVEPVPAVAPAIQAAAAGMGELRAQIRSKDAQDWEPQPWEPLNPNDHYAGAEGEPAPLDG